MPSLKQRIQTRLKSPVRRWKWQYRQATWHRRALPDFIIIGAQKSGTSSLHYYLTQHPQILPAYKKEIHFFDGGLTPGVDNFEKGQAWYRAHFPLKKNISDHQKTFEASPLYIFHPIAPKRIFDLVPKVKIIAVLRNPTERAISHYFIQQRGNTEPLSIYEALQEEEKRLEPVIKEKDYKNDIFRRHSYKSRGLYKYQLERYLNYFSWQQILVINSEIFFAKPDKTLKRVFDFVGVDTEFNVQNLNPRNVASNKSDVPPEVYEYLNSYFLPHNQALYELVGESYGW
ncbi:MAG: sulfotransferase [Cyanobacteria bacterium QS_8_48_54]|nr:MAG: sulfotransferase [Cyanobacteria bacterium QS_8_48_54]